MAHKLAEHETIWSISSFAIYNLITAIYIAIILTLNESTCASYNHLNLIAT